MPRRALVLAATLCLSFAAAAAAQQGPAESAMRWFDSYDLDKDGTVTPAEIRNGSAKEFAALDTNKDGLLTVEEYVAYIPGDRADEIARGKKRFGIADRNGDGKLTLEELTGFGLRIIEIADQNADGKMSRQEFIDSVTPAP